MMRGFENNFKRSILELRRRSKDAIVALADNTVLGRKSVDGAFAISSQHRFRRPKRWFEQRPREHRSTNEAVNASARIIRVKRNQSMKRMLLDFALQQPHVSL